LFRSFDDFSFALLYFFSLSFRIRNFSIFGLIHRVAAMGNWLNQVGNRFSTMQCGNPFIPKSVVMVDYYGGFGFLWLCSSIVRVQKAISFMDSSSKNVFLAYLSISKLMLSYYMPICFASRSLSSPKESWISFSYRASHAFFVLLLSISTSHTVFRQAMGL
jgi:hypothetical protein